MPRRKFKVSKSIVARLAAIGVLSGMGGVAIYQSQQSNPDDDVAQLEQDSDASPDDEEGDSEAPGEGSGDDAKDSQLGMTDESGTSGSESIEPPARSNRIMPSLQPGQGATGSNALSLGSRSGSSNTSGAGGLSMPATKPPGSPDNSSPDRLMPRANPATNSQSASNTSGEQESLTIPRPGATPPPSRTVSLTDQDNPSRPNEDDPIGSPTPGGSGGLSMPGTTPPTRPGTAPPRQPSSVNATASDGPARPLPGVNDLRNPASASLSDTRAPASPSGASASLSDPTRPDPTRPDPTRPDSSPPSTQPGSLRVPGGGGTGAPSISPRDATRDAVLVGAAAAAGAGAVAAATQDTPGLPTLGPPPTRPGTSPPPTNPSSASLSDIPGGRSPAGGGAGLANPDTLTSTPVQPTSTTTSSPSPLERPIDSGSTNPRSGQVNNLTVPSTETGSRDPLARDPLGSPPPALPQGRAMNPNSSTVSNPYSNPGSNSPSISPRSMTSSTDPNEETSGQTQNPYASPRSGLASSGSRNPDTYGNNRYSSAPQVNSSAVSDTPGGIELDGAQSPSLAMEKRAPREIQVGRLATFETVIQNVGPTEATDVIVTDRIPAGTRLESVTPEPITNSGGLLVWNLGSIKPGRAQTITMNLVPERRGEIGSVAQVTFNAKVGVRTICTQPKLEIDVEAPEKVLIGQDVVLRINIANNGDGAASNVIIEEDVPDGVSHPEGREIQYPLGNLGPGERRQLALTLRAESASQVRNIISVRGDDNAFAESQTNFEVVAPSLQVTMSGPRKRYLERTTIHRIRIENRGTAPATRVEIVAQLPKGLKFQETNNHGTYDPATHSVYWGLEELPEGTVDDSIQLVTLPVEPGDQHIDYQATADLNLADSRRQSIEVVQLAELFFDIDDVADPIEVNGETMYHLKVTNQGSKVATQVRLMVEFPGALEPVSAEGPIKHTMRDQTIFFEPIERIAPGEEVLLKLHARGLQAGDHRVVVSLTSDDNSAPIVKQASTNVYVDR